MSVLSIIAAVVPMTFIPASHVLLGNVPVRIPLPVHCMRVSKLDGRSAGPLFLRSDQFVQQSANGSVHQRERFVGMWTFANRGLLMEL
jgi:hypothetical protein